MKLWEVKAQALRLMFADTDVEFSFEEFESGVIYENANTREKLIRMNDSVKRAIDLFFQYNGEISQMTTRKLISSTTNNITTYFNQLHLSAVSNIGYPTRIDVIENLENNIQPLSNISFDYDQLAKAVHFFDNNYAYYEDKIDFRVYYKIAKVNLPDGVNELTYELNDLGIPVEVQRQIPLYIKGEIFQEDEAGMAQQARNEYMQFLIQNQRKNFSKVQTKVKKVFKRRFNV
jgi:hypothetical protein